MQALEVAGYPEKSAQVVLEGQSKLLRQDELRLARPVLAGEVESRSDKYHGMTIARVREYGQE